MTRSALIPNPPPGLRDRTRADGSVRIWWEPSAKQRKGGAVPVELRPDNIGWSVQRAKTLTKEADARLRGEVSATTTGRSVSAVILDYLASRHFTKLAPSTQRVYRSDLNVIEGKWGAQPVAAIDPPVMNTWYETLHRAKGVFRSRAILIMAGIMFLHAERRGWRPKGSNPCRDLDMERPAGRTRRGDWAELDALLAAARDLNLPAIRLALLMVIFTGQRQTDLLLARPEDFQVVRMVLPGAATPRPVWVWSLIRNKVGNAGQITLLDHDLVAALRLARLQARRGPGALLWDEATGGAYTHRLFWARWEAVRARAATAMPSVATLQWRDLRRTFASLARRGGASRDDVGDIIGNTAASNDDLDAVYMSPELATTARAVMAVQRPEKKPEGRKKA